MKTEELIAMLARGEDVAAPARTATVPIVLVAGLLASIALMQAMLRTLPQLGDAIAWPAFWLKVGFALAMSAAAWHAASALARPGAPTAALPWWLAAPLLVLWLAAAVMLAQAAPDQRAALFWGSTWRACPVLIAMLSAPLLAASLWTMRQMAPTRLRLAGAAAGLAAGAAGALVYCLHCPEMSPAFVGTWYVLGMLVPTAIGTLLGPRVLAW
ncbi:DUF1109 domain-containing protein [Massilia sp. S19_KUP03_FR1]|uniref:DUF1109 domain-containing protein n=1 Tax=Massilia sp. S19_KUP03_FR1 TaxID=3025503 RepID=UPI002FCD5C36